jgi:hypothetical protein
LGSGSGVAVALFAQDVAGDQRGRVFQIFAVKLELLVRFVQIFVRPFVLPDKFAAKEDIGKPFGAVRLGGLGFEPQSRLQIEQSSFTIKLILNLPAA